MNIELDDFYYKQTKMLPKHTTPFILKKIFLLKELFEHSPDYICEYDTNNPFNNRASININLTLCNILQKLKDNNNSFKNTVDLEMPHNKFKLLNLFNFEYKNIDINNYKKLINKYLLKITENDPQKEEIYSIVKACFENRTHPIKTIEVFDTKYKILGNNIKELDKNNYFSVYLLEDEYVKNRTISFIKESLTDIFNHEKINLEEDLNIIVIFQNDSINFQINNERGILYKNTYKSPFFIFGSTPYCIIQDIESINEIISKKTVNDLIEKTQNTTDMSGDELFYNYNIISSHIEKLILLKGMPDNKNEKIYINKRM